MRAAVIYNWYFSIGKKLPIVSRGGLILSEDAVMIFTDCGRLHLQIIEKEEWFFKGMVLIIHY